MDYGAYISLPSSACIHVAIYRRQPDLPVASFLDRHLLVNVQGLTPDFLYVTKDAKAAGTTDGRRENPGATSFNCSLITAPDALRNSI